MKKIFLDANTVIDILNNINIGKPRIDILKISQCCISPLTIHIVWYLWEKGRIDVNRDTIYNELCAYSLLQMSNQVFLRGYELAKGDDVEDGMQIACCLENNIEAIMSSDQGLIAKYGKLIEMIPN